MVAAVRQGDALRTVARQFRVSLSTVQWWVRRAGGRPLDQVDWSDQPRRPHRIQRTPRIVEAQVLTLRRVLRTESALGEYGAPAIYRELVAQGGPPPPSVRTIGRILERRGALDDHRRVRRPPPPRGWYLPTVAAGEAELDSWDVIEGLTIEGGPTLEVLTAISLHGSLTGAWPIRAVTAQAVVVLMLQHWRTVALPRYAQFDNDTVFQGAHQHRDSIGRVMRLCLGLGVVPVFTPPREPGFQAAIESFNARWQAVVWGRFHHASVPAVQQCSLRYIVAHRQRTVARRDTAPARRPVPRRWTLDLQRHPSGTVIFLRRTNDRGHVHLLGRTFPVDRHWPHRLVRAEVDLDTGEIRCYALRRRRPEDQPLLTRLPYELPRRPFQG